MNNIRPNRELDREASIRVLFVTTSMSRAGGGITPVIRQLAASLREVGNCSVNVAALWDEHSNQDAKKWDPIIPQAFSTIGPKAWGYSPGLSRHVAQSQPDIMHRHGIWNYPSRVVHRHWRRAQVPYVVSIHGMLNREALRISRLRKYLFSTLSERSFLDRAACIHALTEREVETCRAFGLTNPIALIPNGIDLPDRRVSGTIPWPNPNDGRKILLYLGRLHPIKGLPTLLNSFADERRRCVDLPWRLVIAGWEEEGHRKELEALCHNRGLNGCVDLIGPVYEEAKDAAFRNADAFVLPSRSEALPVSVLEAWSYGIATVMTNECNMTESEAMNASIIADGTLSGMTGGLRRLFQLTDAERQAIGANGRQLAAEKYGWTKIGGDMHAVYRWLLRGGAQPECVI